MKGFTTQLSLVGNITLLIYKPDIRIAGREAHRGRFSPSRTVPGGFLRFTLIDVLFPFHLN